MLVSSPGLDPAQFEADLGPHAEAFAKACATIGATSRFAVQVHPDPLAAAAGDRVVVPVSAVLEATLPAEGDAGRLVPLVEHLGIRLSGIVDASRSAIVVGDTHELLPDRGEILLLLATYRLPSLDQAGFNRHWLDVHAPLALSLMSDADKLAQGYVQLHADEAVSATASGLARFAPSGYAGVLECTVDSIETFLRIHSNPEFDAQIYADEAHFVDRGADFRGAFLRIV